MNILGNQVKEKTNISDEVILDNLIASSTAAANAYLNVILQCSTPELRTMAEESLSQILSGHAQLSKLAIDKDFGSPYAPPHKQLTQTLEKSKIVLDKAEL